MGDKFFVNPSSRKRRAPRPQNRLKEPIGHSKIQNRSDDEITSESEADSGVEDLSDAASSESDDETEADKRRRLAKEYLASLETDLVEGFDAKDLDEDIISRRLRHDAAEQQGHIFRDLRHSCLSEVRKTRAQQCRNLTSVATPPPPPPSAATSATTASTSSNVYIGAKDGSLSKWVLRGTPLKPHMVSRIVCSTPTLDRKPSSPVLCVAASSKLVAVGLHGGFAVYSAESLELLREFRVHGNALSLVFRRGTNELYVGATDLRLRTYDLSQWAFVETLHGHQDEIIGLSALSQERCVSVGARDRTAIFWKIPEESRLTFRGGDTKLAARLASAAREQEKEQEKEQENVKTDGNDTDTTSNTAIQTRLTPAQTAVLEGSIDCCAMLDHQLFITGSDNGNVSLWSTNKKKPQAVVPRAHGSYDALTPKQASGETDPERAEIPPALPRPISAVAAVPFSNTFVTGSTSGTVSVWVLEGEREFVKTHELNVGPGFVTGLCVSELGNEEFAVIAVVSREPRLGRWRVESGRDQVVSFTLSPERAK